MKLIHQNIGRLFRYLGRSIARHPLYFLFIPLILTFLLSLGILRVSYQRNIEVLFSPTNGRALKERELALKYFSLNLSTECDLSRAIVAGMGIIIILKPIDGKSILREHIYQEIRILDKTIRNLTIRWRDKELNYSQICATNFGKCFENVGIFDDEIIRDFRKGIFSMKYPVEIDFKTYKITSYVLNFGGVTTDKNGYFKEALAFRLIYPISSGSKRTLEISQQWQFEVKQRIQNMQFRYIDIAAISFEYEENLKQFTENVISFGSLSIFSILLFCMLACMTTDWIRSKPWLGLSAFVSSVLATISSFGMMMLCGVEFIDMNCALPFLMIGMGIDDSFVLLAAWRRCDSHKEVSSRLEATYSEVALSITITSLTNIISFVAGIFTPFPAISIFCTYAATGICFDFLYQMTFFGSCLAITGYREHKGLHPFTCRKKLTGIEKYKTADKKRTMSSIGYRIGRHMKNPILQAIILTLCFACLGVSIWNITQITEGLDKLHISPAESPAYKYIKFLDTYFTKYPHRVHIIVTEPVNYADKSVQIQIENTLKKFEANPFISGSNFTESWLRAYLMFASSPVSKFSLGAFNISNKQDFIDGLRVFLKFPQTRNFQRDVIFNDNYTEIIVSRLFVLCNDVKDKEENKMLIEGMWNIADGSEIPITVFSYMFFFFEQLVAIRPIAIQTIAIAIASVMIVFFCFLSNAISCICIVLSVLLTITEVMGFMALWDINLDIFSLINLIMYIGFCINYPTHVTYAYITSDDDNSNSRLQSSLYIMGLPIIQGSLSTLLGISILMIDSSYMFMVFVKIGFLVIILTAFHSFFFVPIILDLFDRYCCAFRNLKKNLLERLTSNGKLELEIEIHSYSR